jgi:hypothetical protein
MPWHNCDYIKSTSDPFRHRLQPLARNLRNIEMMSPKPKDINARQE